MYLMLLIFLVSDKRHVAPGTYHIITQSPTGLQPWSCNKKWGQQLMWFILLKSSVLLKSSKKNRSQLLLNCNYRGVASYQNSVNCYNKQIMPEKLQEKWLRGIDNLISLHLFCCLISPIGRLKK